MRTVVSCASIASVSAPRAMKAAAAAFIARGAETEAMLAQLTTVRTLFAQTMASSAAGYTAVDAINEATLAI
ncbi:hypothetical protein MAHJHV59_49450 [Mycobacterium avium subsp. hominissuis]